MRTRLLDQSKANYFKYEMQDLLKSTPIAPELHNALIQTLWAKGSRDELAAAKEFLAEKVKDKTVDPESSTRILRLLDRYAIWR